MAKARKPKAPQGDGPFLDAALICEDVIQEKDQAISAIRAVNRITLHDVTLQPGTLLVLPLILYVGFKAGAVTGKQDLWLYVDTPSGKRSKMPYQQPATTFTFEDGDSGMNMTVQIRLLYESDGTYWIDVILGGRRYSRIPLTIKTGKKAS